MSETQERGPNYDWKHEAEHYRVKSDEYQQMWMKAERQADDLHHALMRAQEDICNSCCTKDERLGAHCIACLDAQQALGIWYIPPNPSLAREERSGK